MSVPQPPKALDGHCSAIDNEQLYVLSSGSFQSIALKQGAQWNEEAVGKAVTGAACARVPGSDPSQSALYVVGGTSSDASYTGLQRYFFGNKTWETLTPPADVMRNRLNHSTVYIPESNKLLVYAGSPSDQPQWLSSQTFTVLAQAPYIIDSYISRGHTANLPILMPWNNSHAVMTGGSDIDATIMLFSAEEGWSHYGTNLSAPLVPGIKGELIQGTDGSKVLQTYDLSVSPNKVSSILLQGADGLPAKVGTVLGGSGSKRDLSAANWPTYNSSAAPTALRTDYSLASDGQGLIAFAGGNADQPVELFNQTTDGWIDSAAYFNSVQSTSSSASPTSSATAAASSSGGVSDATIADANSRQHSLLALELGVIIGVCAAFFLLLLGIFLYLRWRRRRQNNVDKHGEAGRMSFADRGASFMKEAEGPTQNFFPTADRYNNTSPIPPVAPNALRTSRWSKLRFSGSGRGSGHHSRGIVHHHTGSWESTKELVEKAPEYKEIELVPVGKQPIIRKPAPTLQSDKRKSASSRYSRERRQRSSGWSKYFSANNQSDHFHDVAPSPMEYSKIADYGVPGGYSYGPTSALPPLPTQSPMTAMPAHLPASNVMAPLNIDFTRTIDGQRLSKVASSIPSYQESQDEFAKRMSSVEPQSGLIEETDEEDGRMRPISGATASSSNRRRTRSSIAASEYFANQHGINGTWTPITPSFKDHLNNAASPESRRTSSLYTSSVYDGGRRKSGNATFSPGSGSKRNSKARSSLNPPPEADWDAVKDELKFPPELMAGAAAAREANVAVFPDRSNDAYAERGATYRSNYDETAPSNSEHASGMTLFPKAVSIRSYSGSARQMEIGGEHPPQPRHEDDASWTIGAAK